MTTQTDREEPKTLSTVSVCPRTGLGSSWITPKYQRVRPEHDTTCGDRSPGVPLFMRFVQAHTEQWNKIRVWNAQVLSPGWGVRELNLGF